MKTKMRKKCNISMKLRKTLTVTAILVLVMTLPTIIGRTSASEAGESHEAVDAGHGGGSVGEAVGEAEHGVEVEEPWWKFTGWEVVFGVLATMVFMLLIRWLPFIVEDRSGGVL